MLGLRGTCDGHPQTALPCFGPLLGAGPLLGPLVPTALCGWTLGLLEVKELAKFTGLEGGRTRTCSQLGPVKA